MTTRERRKTLQKLAVTIPAVWTPPLVNSVMLPAQAAMSPVQVPTRCANESRTIEELDESSLDDIALIYDGDAFCDVEVGDFTSLGGTADDAMIVIDADPNDDTLWDYGGTGANWSNIGDNFLDDDNASGTYFIEVQRVSPPNVGLQIRATFTVNIVGNSMTVNNVSLTEL